MVDASKYVDNNVPYLRVEDVKNIKGDLNARSVVITGEAYFKDFENKREPGKIDNRLILPVKLHGKAYLISVNKIANERLVSVLGGETGDWVGAKLALMVAGTSMPYIILDVIEKPVKG